MNEKFNKDYIDFINNEFDLEDHKFLFLGGHKSDVRPIPEYSNVEVGLEYGMDRTINWYTLLLKNSYKAEKIYLHGFTNSKVIKFLFYNPLLLKKCNWVIWGGDLYSYEYPKETLKKRWKEFMKTFCIKRFGGLVTYLKGDYELAKKWYGAKGEYLECIMYPSNLYKNLNVIEVDKDKRKTYIQVGNSADQSNNHKEAIDKLVKYKDENVEIICPLSYGNEKYAEEIEKYGKKRFGSKFLALRNFLPFDEYLNVLGKIDIAIFNHKRQQAMGNIITLLGLGKRVYIRDDISTWELFKSISINIKSSNGEISLDLLNEIEEENNTSIIKERFSEKKLKEEWGRIFNG